MNPLDYHILGTMTDKYHKIQPMMSHLGRAAARTHQQSGRDFTKRLTGYMAVAANGSQFEHLQ